MVRRPGASAPPPVVAPACQFINYENAGVTELDGVSNLDKAEDEMLKETGQAGGARTYVMGDIVVLSLKKKKVTLVVVEDRGPRRKQPGRVRRCQGSSTCIA